MSRSIEHIVDMHRLAADRRKAGRPIWDHKIDVSLWWRSEAPFTERRDGIVRAVKRSRWYRQADELSDLYSYVDELADAEDTQHFDQVWDCIYDLADIDRVWIDTLGRSA